MIDIMYVVLPMRAQTEKTTASCKDDSGKSLHVYWGGGKGLVKNQDCTVPSLYNHSCACFHESTLFVHQILDYDKKCF